MNKKTPRNKYKRVKVLALILIIVGVFSPNGFFSGHRTVILEAEVTHAKPEIKTQAIASVETTFIKGNVTSSTGMPISGSMITAFSNDNTRRITAYSDAHGHYFLPVTYSGTLKVRVRTPSFEDSFADISLITGKTHTLNFQTKKLINSNKLSQTLTASAHIATMEWPSDSDRATFISQCNFCHQIGNSLISVIK